MIIYATKQTLERYNLKALLNIKATDQKLIEDAKNNEIGDKLHEWGAKLFYFEKKKCIQVVNMASKLTLFLFDIKVNDLPHIGELISHYLFVLYKDDEQMLKSLKVMLNDKTDVCFFKISDRSAIATLNTTQAQFTQDGYTFYEFLVDGMLQTHKINKTINTDYSFTMKVDNKTEYFYAYDKFKEVVIDRYGL